jgi:hypothetical protein
LIPAKTGIATTCMAPQLQELTSRAFGCEAFNTGLRF